MNRKGRPEEWRIDAQSPAQKHVLTLDKRARITFGVELVAHVGHELLAVMRDAGCVRMLPWTPHGESVERRLLALREQLTRADVVPTLQKLHSRYERVTVDSVGRFVLPPGARLHLGVDRGRVVVWQLPNAIEVWSPSYFTAQLENADDAALEDLP